ncbi:MAG: adenine deaminase C-terminal domain-containing protein [Desulfatiglandales bacterium]
MLSYSFPNRRLLETALGNEPADMVIKDGLLLDVYTGRMLPHRSVAITEKWIAYVGPDASHTVGERTQVIEANNRVISPGFMDAHTHIAFHCDLSDFLMYAIPGGTTTFVTEAEYYVFAYGPEGFGIFLDQARNRPVKIYSLIPPMTSLSPASELFYTTPDDAKEFLKADQVIGLGESYWQTAILTPDNRVLELIQETLRAGKSVQGHAAGASDRKLVAYASAGAQSCHEAISTEDVLARLELGYYVMIREGHIRRDLEIILPIKDQIDLRRLILVTDGTSPELLLQKGYLTDVVQKAVDLGLDPVKAVQMVSLNPAEHLGIDHITGGISPGRQADILLLPEPGKMMPDLVISNGRIVAEKGRTTIPLPRVPFPPEFLKTVRIDPVSISELHLPLDNIGPKEYVRTMDIQLGGLVTREGEVRVNQSMGELTADPENDLLKCVFIERVSGAGEKFIGFVRGWGQKRGAVATSLCWDVSGVIAIGADDHDLAGAINRIVENQGGTALVVGGELVVDIPASAGGYVSAMKIEDLVTELKRFQETVADLGSSLEMAHLTLCTLASAAIPFIRLTEKGYFRFRENDMVGI